MSTYMTRAKPVFFMGLLLMVTACSAEKEVKEANCDALITETRTACVDMVRHGLDVSCNTYLMAVNTAMDQANGDLYDIGDSNKIAANALCSSYVEDLREDRKENAGSMQEPDQVGSDCAALADQFETHCMANLGKEPLADGCRNVARTFAMGRLSQEKKCSLAGAHLPDK